MQEDAYTLPQLATLLDVQYRTLHSWVERGLLRPSLQQSTGTGKRNLFSGRDALTACVLADLRAAGVKFDLLREAASRLREQEQLLQREAFMLVNGDVRVVYDEHEAVAALRHGGLTLSYNTASALERVRRLNPAS